MRRAPSGFTLIELMSALLILSLLALLSFRGLGAVLDARDHVRDETQKWKRVAAFFARFQTDLQLSAPLPLHADAGKIEFGRFASAEGADRPRRIAYAITPGQEIELSIRPESGSESASGAPARYVVLSGVSRFGLQYLDAKLAWVDAWPAAGNDPRLPLAVRVSIELASGEELVRVFALKS